MYKQQQDSTLSAIEDYHALRLKWRRGLNESNCRSLASDFLRGMIDECTYDAYLEYLVRWGHPTQNISGTKKASKKNKKSRYA